MERVARYVQKHSKRIKSAATAAAATFLLIAGAWLGWRFHAESRLGRVELTNDGIPLTVQVLSESGDEAIGEPFGLIRARGPDAPGRRLSRPAPALQAASSRTFRFAVNRGEMHTHALALIEGRLLGGENWANPMEHVVEPAVPFSRATVALELSPGKTELVQPARQSLIRRDGVTGRVIWDASHPARPYEPRRDPSGWLKSFSECRTPGHCRESCSGPERRRHGRPRVGVHPEPVVAGDLRGRWLGALELHGQVRADPAAPSPSDPNPTHPRIQRSGPVKFWERPPSQTATKTTRPT